MTANPTDILFLFTDSLERYNTWVRAEENTGVSPQEMHQQMTKEHRALEGAINLLKPRERNHPVIQEMLSWSQDNINNLIEEQ